MSPIGSARSTAWQGAGGVGGATGPVMPKIVTVPRSWLFELTGSATIEVEAGFAFGIIVGGGNFDTNSAIGGTVHVANLNAPVCGNARFSALRTSQLVDLRHHRQSATPPPSSSITSLERAYCLYAVQLGVSDIRVSRALGLLAGAYADAGLDGASGRLADAIDAGAVSELLCGP